MKHKLIVLALLCIATLALCSMASAATDPIVCTMEVVPSALTEPGDVTITITISNSGDTDMTSPLTLFDPTSQVVKDFGDNGSVMLKAGETKTWTGTWAVNQRTLENGQIVFFVKYTILDDNGASKTQSQPIRAEISQVSYEAKIAVKRTIIPETARKDQAISVIYEITNEGTVSITNLTLEETKDVLADKLTVAPELKAGETVTVKLPVVMGSKDLTSKGTITYTIADGTQEQVYETDEQTIVYAEPIVIATLTSDKKGVLMNETIELTLKLDNTGNVDYSDVRVTDATLGDVFTNLTLPAGEALTLTKEITLTKSTDFQFKILAIDKTGTEVSFDSDLLSLIAMDPNQALKLELTMSSNKSEVYSTKETVRFEVTIYNNSTVDATDVNIYQANTLIYTFDAIPAGESRKLSRDVTLSMAGQYQFHAVAKDTLDTEWTFKSNILQIAFLTPTPAPVTPNPNITPTPEPTFVKATYPKISDPDIGTLPKLLRTFFYPLMIAGFALLFVAIVILLIATKKRNDLKKASENALDHLERSNHRDYIAPTDEETETDSAETSPEEPSAVPEDTNMDELSEEELPHMKYVRNAYQIADREAKDEAQTDDADLSGWEAHSEEPENTQELPHKRRTSRISPYARQSGEMDKAGEPEQGDRPDET
ncbi:MAG TPA: hypothetical protein P5559_02100 [Candidatus Limiplasma sp.]|nr:hypothetical protein [Candidatus Limiplasma sp.]